jgi:signal transduction histidine kinase
MQKTVSEELGAPLTALLELPRLLVDGLQKPLGDTERGQLEIPQERGQEILELIEGLTALSGLQAGGLKITKASTDVATLIQRVVRTLQPRAAAKGNRIETDIKPGVGPVVTDARRVEQVLGFLLTVVERLVVALGGKIKMESEMDRGTWVTVTLPVQG